MKAQKGFTLLEVMIVVVIVAILAAVAVPNYQSYMIKTRRATAAACLLEMSQALERFYTVNLTYVGAALPDIQCSRELANHYIFALPNPAAREYQLTATPQGAQNNNDPYACGTLTMDQAGQKGADKNVNDCWR